MLKVGSDEGGSGTRGVNRDRLGDVSTGDRERSGGTVDDRRQPNIEVPENARRAIMIRLLSATAVLREPAGGN